ncbi:unnamed protein product [Brachionus calyciflorus]|uniref:Coiled-coil domain-containing protein n=2 Tax=Brachionus calyciflorus TaxID=104777 RepID=A0A813WWF3_9BILA|nr:unnamed protein product [Brachionus calyciflorus]
MSLATTSSDLPTITTSIVPNQELIVSNPFIQKELYDLLEKIYFLNFLNSEETNEEFKDTVDFELKRLDFNNTDLKVQVKNLIKKLSVQHEIVGRKLSDIILQNRQAYSIELKRVSDFKHLLEDSHNMCCISRRSLEMSKNLYIHPRLKLIKKQIRKQQLIKLLIVLKEIRPFNNCTNPIIDLINAKEYVMALNLCSKTENLMCRYDHLRCIKGLKKTIRDCYNLIEESLSVSLVKVCRKYDENLFQNIFLAYEKLGKLDEFFDKLSQNLIQIIGTVSLQTLIRLIVSRRFSLNDNDASDDAELAAKIDVFVEELKQKSYTNDLFTLVLFDDYKQSLTDLCSNLWQLMKNFYKMSIWILGNSNQDQSSEGVQEQEKKLWSILYKIWQEVQIKISTYYRSMNLEHFKFDEYLDILIILNRFIELGHEFCNKNSDCNIILQSVKDQTLAYFKFYHVTHLEELKMFLENEIWQCCPVRQDFSVFNLQEYKFLRSNENLNSTESSIELIEKSLSTDTDRQRTNKFEINTNMLELIRHTENKRKKNIFDEINILKRNGHRVKNSEIEFDDYSSSSLYSNDTDYSNEDEYNHSNLQNTPNCEQEMPILTNTTLNIIRLFGKYIHMLSVFKIISFQVISYLMQLFQFYFYYIYLEFTQQESVQQQAEQNEGLVRNLVEKNSTLNSLFKNIKNDLFKNSKFDLIDTRVELLKSVRNREEYLNCINQRIIAAESLIYLSKQLEDLFPLIEKYLPQKNVQNAEINNLEIYTNILKETWKIRAPIYLYIARTSIDYNQLLESISRVNWDLDEILSMHNSYVDILLRQVDDLIKDVQSLKDLIPLNRKILNAILEESLKLIMKVLVDGYASVKKCSNEGRALMQLDFQQLVVKLEKLCDIRPVPDKDYVEAYIKAYYLPDSVIEKWTKEHTEYQPRHIVSLLGIMSQVTKKTRLGIVSSFASNNSNQSTPISSTISPFQTTMSNINMN